MDKVYLKIMDLFPTILKHKIIMFKNEIKMFPSIQCLHAGQNV